MALRGGLGRTFNVSYVCLALILWSFIVYSLYELGTLSFRRTLCVVGSFLLGLVVGTPAGLMNRRALQELYRKLDGKFYLSSQFPLFESRQGKNALVYFYVLITVAISGSAVFPRTPQFLFGFFVVGAYFATHLLPFVFKLKQ